MSALASVQNRLTDISHKTKNIFDPDALLGINALPHNAQYEEQQKQKKNAEDLASQQAADAARAAEGPQAMTVRGQNYNSASAQDIVSSGNETGLGQPLDTSRRRAARRVLIG